MDPSMTEIVDSISKAGIGVVAMKVMAGGNRTASRRSAKENEILGRDGALLSALKWCLKNKNVHTTIPSITDMDQLDENLKAMAIPFSSADEKILTARLRNIRPTYCSMCNGCDGSCSKGLPVADILRYLMYAENYGEFALGYGEYRNLPEQLTSVRCADCSSCTVQCVNGVRVAERISRAQECFA
jgi:predicted aldo/keto reductase-like oxidoreductase